MSDDVSNIENSSGKQIRECHERSMHYFDQEVWKDLLDTRICEPKANDQTIKQMEEDEKEFQEEKTSLI